MSSRAPRRTAPVYHSVFVGHINFGVSKTMLYDLFKGFGDIHEIYLNQNLSGQGLSFTYGFVRFKERTAAERAIAEMNGWPVKGQALRVELSEKEGTSRDDPSAPAPASAEDYSNLVKLMDAMTEVAQTAEADPDEETFWPEDLLLELSKTPFPPAPPAICQPSKWSP